MDSRAVRFSKRILHCAPVLAVLFLCACSITKNLDIAKRAVDQFHRQFAAGQDDAIYDSADPVFKRTVNKAANRELLSRIRQKVGACKDSAQMSYFVNASTGGTFVTLVYSSKCANGELAEEFVWHVRGNEAVLFNYKASGRALSQPSPAGGLAACPDQIGKAIRGLRRFLG